MDYLSFDELMTATNIRYKRKVTLLIKEGVFHPVMRPGFGKAYWFTQDDVENYHRVYGRTEKSIPVMLSEFETRLTNMERRLSQLTSLVVPKADS